LAIKKQALLCHRSQNPEKIWDFHDGMHRARAAECGAPRAAEAYLLVEAKPGCELLPVTFLSRK
jgi:hypothetical protein